MNARFNWLTKYCQQLKPYKEVVTDFCVFAVIFDLQIKQNYIIRLQ